MSNSRLEKFIYAICSMDVSDLPVPLSRIEKLWNCLITGETPDFEPLSRNEKYLMAMLDRYDISNLPAPMSRGEKLLYKIAVGETDLSDVPGYLSRYEELLKYLIENGGISEDDFKYVLYTLNQSLYTLYTTAEKPVKSAILKGQTLVNIVPATFYVDIQDITTEWGYSNFLYLPNNGLSDDIEALQSVKSNTKYLFRFYVEKNTVSGTFRINNPSEISIFSSLVVIEGGKTGWFNFVLTTEDITDKTVAIRLQNGNAINGDVKINKIMLIEYVDGMENWDIPYFEGMQSVKMPVLKTIGKNLFDMKNSNFITEKDGNYYPSSDSNLFDTYKLLPNTTYTISGIFDSWGKCFINGVNMGNFNSSRKRVTKKFTTNSTGVTTIYFGANAPANALEPCYDFQLEIGDAFTSYEPHKSNILSTPSDLELREIDEVKDELNLMTGELTERIGGVVLNGSEDETYNTVVTSFNGSSNTIIEFVPSENLVVSLENDYTNAFLSNYNYKQEFDIDWITNSSNVWGIYLGVTDNKTTVRIIVADGTTDAEVRQHLQENPLRIVCKLAAPTIKTVDLTVVDQDNQPTQLGTFENITHVSLEAENLIPEVEIEVATKLLEDTVFNLTNAFNTLYPTAEKPVVDGTLYGQTLLSVSNYTFLTGKYLNVDNGNFNGGGSTHRYAEDYFVIPEGTQVITLKGVNNYKKICYYDSNKQFIIGYSLLTQNIDDFTTDVPTGASYFRFNTSLTEIMGGTPIVVDEYLHVYVDDYLYLTNKPDYMDGAKLISCKMPVLTTIGKNLFDFADLELGDLSRSNGTPVLSTKARRNKSFISVDGSQNFSFSMPNYIKTEGARYVVIHCYNINKEYISYIILGDNLAKYENKPFLEGTKFVKITIEQVNQTNPTDVFEVQLEYGKVVTTYEPYQSNILTTPSDLELRGIGKVRDTLDCLTGELTQRIGEVVLDGSEEWTPYPGYVGEGNSSFVATITSLNNKHNDNVNNVINDKFISGSWFDYANNQNLEIVWSNNPNQIGIRVKSEKASDVDGIKEFLSANNIKINYELATPVVKTVDLTVVDQDGNPTTLKTFDDTTHVLLESEGLIPTASLTVRTKIPSGSSTSLLMDDISTKQEHLNTTIDEQSNNVDATMIATTEIFEETL